MWTKNFKHQLGNGVSPLLPDKAMGNGTGGLSGAECNLPWFGKRTTAVSAGVVAMINLPSGVAPRVPSGAANGNAKISDHTGVDQEKRC